MTNRIVQLTLPAVLATLLVGCVKQPTMFPNPDPLLNKNSAQWAADAATRTYPASAPRAFEPRARAQAAYDLNRMELVNFTGQDWVDLEVWVNGEYVCYLPRMEDRRLKEVHFPMLYNARGQHFPMDNRKTVVKKVEVYVNGTLYSVRVHNADF